MRGDAQIVVTGLGMVSAVGRDVVTSCASARAGISRVSELDLEVLDDASLEMEPVTGFRIAGLTDGFTGFGRLARLAHRALQDLIDYSRLPASMLRDAGVILHLPDHHYDDQLFFDEADDLLGERSAVEAERHAEIERYRRKIQDRLIPLIFQLNGIEASGRFRRCSFGGAGVFADQLAAAKKVLRDGSVDACVVGAADSLVEPHMVEKLRSLGLLKAPDGSEGFLPGEAAAFLLLERRDTAEKRQARIEAVIDATATSREDLHRFSGQPPTGRGLSRAISSAFETLTPPLFENWLGIGNLNGDSWRAQDFGTALMFLKAGGVPADFDHLFPATSFGETGAAAGAVAACVGVRGLARGYITEPAALVWLASDDGNYGAFFLRRINNQRAAHA